MSGHYLVTCDNWFYAPDGKLYRSVWGHVEVIQDSFLGVKTNSHSSNWFLKVGTNQNHVIIAGCQVHYAVLCWEKPILQPTIEEIIDNQKKVRDNAIYIAL
jgi:hypothetical protein